MTSASSCAVWLPARSGQGEGRAPGEVVEAGDRHATKAYASIRPKAAYAGGPGRGGSGDAHAGRLPSSPEHPLRQRRVAVRASGDRLGRSRPRYPQDDVCGHRRPHPPAHHSSRDQARNGGRRRHQHVAWNNHRHHELYWATASTGRVCHTLNLRLFPEQLVYIVNHAEDRAIFVDPDLAPVLAPLIDQFASVEHVVVMGADASAIPGAIAYEDLIADVPPIASWPILDERSPMMFCYTSGTTGNPKGVAYTQRSTYLHTISNLAANPVGAEDNVLPVVPMFHAAAWGYPFMAVTVGAKLTYPESRPVRERASRDLFVDETGHLLGGGPDGVAGYPTSSRSESRHRPLPCSGAVLADQPCRVR